MMNLYKYLFVTFMMLMFSLYGIRLSGQHAFPPVTSIEFQESLLPVVVINTDGAVLKGKELDERIAATIKIIDNGPGIINSVHDMQYAFDGFVGIKYRGNSSFFNSPKKPYSLEMWDQPYTTDSLSSAVEQGLLGMNPSTDWALLAPYNDKSYIRDVLLFELMRGTQEFVPNARYCELIFNGVYHGLYILAERVQRGKHRLDIPSNKNKTGKPEECGYHLEVDRDDDPGFRSDKDIRNLLGNRDGSRTRPWYQFKYPKEHNLTAEQRDFIMNRVKEFETVMESDAFNHPENGYAKYIEPQSVAAFVIAQEISRNVDGYRLSTPLYKYADSKDKRFRMSVWDFNIAFGNADYGWGWSPEGWSYNQTAFAAPFWFKQMLRDEVFVDLMKNKWKTLRSGQLKMENIMLKIDSLYSHIQEAVVRNDYIWDMAGRKVWPNYFLSQTHQEEIAYLKRWIQRRVAWMDDQWSDNPQNLMANGSFDNDTDYGNNASVLSVSQWPKLGGQPLVNQHVFSGDYAYEFKSRNIASQIVTELTPGLYTLLVKIKTEGTPDAYMFAKNHGRSEQKVSIPNVDGEFRTVELRNIEVLHPHCEIGIAAWYSTGSTSARVWYDDIVLFRQNEFSKVQSAEDYQVNVNYNENAATLVIFTNFSLQNQSVMIFDIAGKLIFSRPQFGGHELQVSLYPGIYMFTMYHDNQWMKRNFIVTSR
jgi:hypothetical protein